MALTERTTHLGIQEVTGYSRATVNRGLRELREMGLAASVMSNAGKTVYRLMEPKMKDPFAQEREEPASFDPFAPKKTAKPKKHKVKRVKHKAKPKKTKKVKKAPAAAPAAAEEKK